MITIPNPRIEILHQVEFKVIQQELNHQLGLHIHNEGFNHLQVEIHHQFIELLQIELHHHRVELVEVVIKKSVKRFGNTKSFFYICVN